MPAVATPSCSRCRRARTSTAASPSPEYSARVPDTPTIVALGGHDMSPGEPLNRFLLGLTRVERPRMLFIATASGDNDFYTVRFHEAFGRAAVTRHLRLFAIPPPDLRSLVLDQH